MSSVPQTCIGLTGGIGCGKSTVARLFEAKGVRIIDADAIAHQLTQANGAGMDEIRTRFGSEYVLTSGELDRPKMRHLVFSDRDTKAKLERILHPLILATCAQQIATPSAAPYTLLMAPLLLEHPSFLKLVQRVLLVDCCEQQQISRVMQRSGLDESQIRAIIALQMPRAVRISRTKDIIKNEGTLDDLAVQVNNFHDKYCTINNNHLTAS
ncbi:MAG: dephospho-CoA kinase [Nitrosomonadales bacterium]